MAKKSEKATVAPAAPKPRMVAPVVPVRAADPVVPREAAKATPTFPTPRVLPVQHYEKIVCRYCGTEDVYVLLTKPKAPVPHKIYECLKCALCPTEGCGVSNPLFLEGGRAVFSRVLECKRCRTQDSDHGTYYVAAHGSQFKVLQKRAQV